MRTPGVEKRPAPRFTTRDRSGLTGFARWSALMLLFAGCYSFPAPLSPPEEAVIDERILGEWRCLSSDGEQAISLAFRRFDANQYEIVTLAPKERDEAYRAHATTLKNRTFLNVRSVEDIEENGDWIYLRYDIPRPGVLDLRILDEEPLRNDQDDPARIRKTIKKNIDNRALYLDLCLCVRRERESSAGGQGASHDARQD
jgi:hypothetical protein